MSFKAWIRKVLDVKPEVITRTTFVYPSSNESDEVKRVISRFDQWFHFNDNAYYKFSAYESDIYKCAAELLGPAWAQDTLDDIRNMWGLNQFYSHQIPEGRVVVDYINSKPDVLSHFHKYHNTNQKSSFDLTQEEFKAIESIEKELVDIKLIQFDFAESVEILLNFAKKFTKSEVEEKRD